MNLFADITNYKTVGQFNRSIDISLKHNYIFFALAKNASSTIRYYLQIIELAGSGLNTGNNIINVHDKLKSPLLYPNQLPESQFITILNSEQFIKFVFVRNPYIRLLSCYLDRIVKWKNSNPRKKICSILEKESGADISFSEFIDAICAQEPFDMDEHWRIQYYESLYPLVKFSFIGKFESLNKDLDYIFNIIFKSKKTKLKWEKLHKKELLNKSPSKQSSEKFLLDFYNEHLAKKVYEKYILDFETFGYSYGIGDI